MVFADFPRRGKITSGILYFIYLFFNCWYFVFVLTIRLTVNRLAVFFCVLIGSGLFMYYDFPRLQPVNPQSKSPRFFLSFRERVNRQVVV